MNNGEVKRWEIKATKWDNPKAEWRFHDSEGPGFPGYDSPPPCIKVMRVEDHDRVVAELETQVSEIRFELEAKQRPLSEQVLEQAQTIATQRRVIAILKEQRNVAHERARVSADEMMQFIQEDDAEIAAIEKGGPDVPR